MVNTLPNASGCGSDAGGSYPDLRLAPRLPIAAAAQSLSALVHDSGGKKPAFWWQEACPLKPVQEMLLITRRAATPGRKTVRRLAPNGELATVRRFPSEAKLIKRLIAADQSFRELCNDLALADQALAAADQLPEDIRADRVAKCQVWMEGLEKEIAWELNKAKISPSER